jgi:hypothetical protein
MQRFDRCTLQPWVYNGEALGRLSLGFAYQLFGGFDIRNKSHGNHDDWSMNIFRSLTVRAISLSDIKANAICLDALFGLVQESCASPVE